MNIELSAPVRETIIALQAQNPNLEQVTILRNWVELTLRTGAIILCGDVENHPRLGNATDIRTTRVRYLNETIGLAVTKNTIYILKDKL